MNRLVTALAALSALTAVACASPGAETASDLAAAQLGATSLYEVDGDTAAAVIARADHLGLESFAHGRHVPVGCEAQGEPRVSATPTDDGTMYLIESSAFCADVGAERSLVSAYVTTAGVADATWRASFDYVVDGVARQLVERGFVGERLRFDVPSTRREGPEPTQRVVAEGSFESSDCDSATLSASWVAYEQAIGLCGENTVAHAVPEGAEYIAQHIADRCRMTVIMPYDCFAAASPEGVVSPAATPTRIDPTPAPADTPEVATTLRDPSPQPSAEAGERVVVRVWATHPSCETATFSARHRMLAGAAERCAPGHAEQTAAAPGYTVDVNDDGCVVHMTGTFTCTTAPFAADLPHG